MDLAFKRTMQVSHCRRRCLQQALSLNVKSPEKRRTIHFGRGGDEEDEHDRDTNAATISAGQERRLPARPLLELLASLVAASLNDSLRVPFGVVLVEEAVPAADADEFYALLNARLGREKEAAGGSNAFTFLEGCVLRGGNGIADCEKMQVIAPRRRQ